MVELLDRSHQAEVALLHEIKKHHAAADIALGDRHDQTQVCPDEFIACPVTVTNKTLVAGKVGEVESVDLAALFKYRQVLGRLDAALDSRSDSDFLAGIEQRHPSDFLEVHPNRIIGAATVAGPGTTGSRTTTRRLDVVADRGGEGRSAATRSASTGASSPSPGSPAPSGRSGT